MVINILNKQIGGSNRCFIVAEAGVNHDGDPEKAKKLIDAIAEAGADAVKLQTWKTGNIILEETDMAGYQKENLGLNELQSEMLKKLELRYDVYFELKKYAEEKGLILFSTMEDPESIDFLVEKLNIPIVKVGSGDLTNYILLAHTARFRKPMILSTGMATMDEIAQAIKIVHSEGNENVIVLQCTTQYPCPYEDANINVMATLQDKFKVIVGFSDHTMGIECSIAAVALGAKVIEKHITLDRGAFGPDHSASLEPHEFKAMVKAIRNVEKSFGSGIKQPSVAEIETKKVVVRKVVAARDIVRGEIVDDGNVTFKRSNEGLEAKNYPTMIKGRIAKVAIGKNRIIMPDMVN